jgi:hypothetical protein
MKGTLIFTLLLTIPLRAAERDPSGYERVLLPVVSASPIIGINGSRWITELTIRNESDVPAHIFQDECAFFCECIVIESRTE